MDIEQTEIHYFRQFNPLDKIFYLKIVETRFSTFIFGHFCQYWAKIGPKLTKNGQNTLSGM